MKERKNLEEDEFELYKEEEEAGKTSNKIILPQEEEETEEIIHTPGSILQMVSDAKSLIKDGNYSDAREVVGKIEAASKQIRDFRGAMVGRTDKGLFITTGTFTRDAKLEATRDGAPPIDLIDGDQLVEKMKELGLGVKVKSEELVDIDQEWFKSF